MERQVLGRVRGSMWYSGTGITGTSTTPTVFAESGVTKAYENDLYLNTHATSSDRGNVYACTLGGDAATAKWAYAGTIIGPLPDVIDNLDSTSSVYALSANMGRKLKELLDNAGIYAKVIIPNYDDEVYTVSMVIENADTTIRVHAFDGTEGTYSFTAGSGTADRTVTFTINDIFGESSVKILWISSSDAAIKSYVLYDQNGDEIMSETPSIWERIMKNEMKVMPDGTLTDGGDLHQMADILKWFNGEIEQFFPITHARAVWFSISDQLTVFDIIKETLDYNQMINTNHYYASIADEDGDILVDEDDNEIVGDWSYNIA